jgi:hypothetical protein
VSEKTIDALIRAEVHRVMADEAARIETDLATIPGVHMGMSAEEAAESNIEVVYQCPERSFVEVYRGIRQNGAWVIDYHPTWPYNEEPSDV